MEDLRTKIEKYQAKIAELKSDPKENEGLIQEYEIMIENWKQELLMSEE